MHVLRPRSTEPRGLVGCTGEQPPQGPLAFTAPLPVLGEQRGAAAVTCAACSPAVHARRPVLLTGTLGGLGPAVRGRGSVPSGLCTAVTRGGRLSRLSPVGGLASPPGSPQASGERSPQLAVGARAHSMAPEFSSVQLWARVPVPPSVSSSQPPPRLATWPAPSSEPAAEGPPRRAPSEDHAISAPFRGSPDEAWPTGDCPPSRKSPAPRQGLGLGQMIPGQSQAAPHPREAILRGRGAIAEGSVWPAGATSLGIAKPPPGEEGAPCARSPCRLRVGRGATRGAA